MCQVLHGGPEGALQVYSAHAQMEGILKQVVKPFAPAGVLSGGGCLFCPVRQRPGNRRPFMTQNAGMIR